MTASNDDKAPEPAAPEHAPTCPWCAAPAAPDATRCSACGAALAQRDSLGGVQIAGLTAVDPALAEFDKRPLHIPGPSPTHGFAPSLAVGAVAGGPVGLMAFGGLAAIAGAELLASTRGGTSAEELADVGRPSEVALLALEHIADAEAPGTSPAVPGAPADDDGPSIWRDLPTEA